MIANIECATCSEVIGTIEKSEISEQDILDYQSMVMCSNGHINVVELVEVPSGDQET